MNDAIKMRHYMLRVPTRVPMNFFVLRSELQLWPTINFRMALPIAAKMMYNKFVIAKLVS